LPIGKKRLSGQEGRFIRHFFPFEQRFRQRQVVLLDARIGTETSP
jgi:hypothetical protein